MKRFNKIIYLIICLIIITGIIVWKQNGFNLELQYSTREQIAIVNEEGINIDEVKSIVSDVLNNQTRFFVQEVGKSAKEVVITADTITDEQKNEIVNKFNEKYGTKIKSSDIEKISIPNTKIIDAIKPYFIPAIIVFGVLLFYSLIRFRILKIKKVLGKIVILPLLFELLLYSIIVITRIPFGRITIAAGVVLYPIVIGLVINCMENEREEKKIENVSKERID